MANKDLPIVVVDSSCFLAYLLDEPEDNKAARVEHLLAAHESDYLVGIPAIAYLEILGTAQKGPGGVHGGHARRRLREFEKAKAALDSRKFLPIEFNRPILDLTIDIMPTVGLKGADCLILASAIATGATHLYTYDHDLLNLKSYEHESTNARIAILEPYGEEQHINDLSTELFSENLEVFEGDG